MTLAVGGTQTHIHIETGPKIKSSLHIGEDLTVTAALQGEWFINYTMAAPQGSGCQKYLNIALVLQDE